MNGPHTRSNAPGRAARRLASTASLAAACLWLNAGCVTTQVEPGSGAGSGPDAAPLQRKLVDEARYLEETFRAKGMIYEDPAARAYFEAVAARVVPADAGEEEPIRCLLFRQMSAQAFSLPDGSIYLGMGLLNRLENEAQLAFVLAHEATHVRNRDAQALARRIKQLKLIDKLTAFESPITSLGLIGEVSMLSWVRGYGDDREREADTAALQDLIGAGYPPGEALRFLDLMDEASTRDGNEDLFYGDPSSNEARRAWLREALSREAGREAGRASPGEAAYLAATSHLLVEGIRTYLDWHYYEAAASEAVRTRARLGNLPELHYWEGEAHRRMAEDPEGLARERAVREDKRDYAAMLHRCTAEGASHVAAAAAAYAEALALDPAFLSAHRGLGLVARQRGDRAAAREHLEAYLAGEGREKDQRYIERILEELGP